MSNQSCPHIHVEVQMLRELDGGERREKDDEGDGRRNTRFSVVTDSSEDDEDEEFEFSFVHQFHEQTEDDLADNLFCDGQIRPVYPVFDRTLLGQGITDKDLSLFRKIAIDDDGGNSRSIEKEEESRPDPESYCVWNPMTGPPRLSPTKKSRSAGESSSRRWRLRDLVVGRSHSDGKQKFFFLEKNKEKGNEKEEEVVVVEKKAIEGKEKRVKKGSSTETTMTRAYRLYYAKDPTAGDRNLHLSNSQLPYRRNLFG